MKLINADERIAEEHGVTILLTGPAGAGKTWQANTFSPERLEATLHIDADSGDLPIRHLPLTTVRPANWQDCMDLAAVIGGPIPTRPAYIPYSQAHFDQVVANPDLARLRDFGTLLVDNLSSIARLSFQHAELLPEATTDKGKRDLRGIYGIHARQLLDFLHQIQRARNRVIVLSAILERDDDPFVPWRPQLEGAKVAKEIAGVVDEVITLAFVDFGDGKPTRAFICTSPNAWSYPAKDRSGRLDQIEEPHLGKLLAKLTSPSPTGGTS